MLTTATTVKETAMTLKDITELTTATTVKKERNQFAEKLRAAVAALQDIDAMTTKEAAMTLKDIAELNHLAAISSAPDVHTFIHQLVDQLSREAEIDWRRLSDACWATADMTRDPDASLDWQRLSVFASLRCY